MDTHFISYGRELAQVFVDKVRQTVINSLSVFIIHLENKVD